MGGVPERAPEVGPDTMEKVRALPSISEPVSTTGMGALLRPEKEAAIATGTSFAGVITRVTVAAAEVRVPSETV